MVLRVLVVIVLLIVAVLTFAALKPNNFRIQRSEVINAPQAKIFALINDLHNWPRWAPQDREDSSLHRTFSGKQSGVGAMSAWTGSGSSGSGTMLIIESLPPQKVTIQADWTKPFVARNINEFTLTPAGNGTRVTWSMHGPYLYMMKLMSVFTNMDHMMGQHFESGLANLKRVAEQQ